MIGCIRETGLVAPLAGGALMATVLFSISACVELPFSLGLQPDARPAEADAALAAMQHAPEPEERMSPPIEAAAPKPAPPVPPEKPALLLLTVEAGDTLSHIALRYGVEAIAIIALNDLSHPYWLRTGQRLVLPRTAHVVARRGETPARVTPGEPVRTVIAVPTPRIDVEPAPPLQAEPAPPGSSRSNGSRVARAEQEATPPTPTVYALARRSNSADVPLPPTRNTFLWPLEGRVISGFGSKPGGKHNDGINIAVPIGSEVRASQNGVVAYAGNELRGYGNLVLIRHDGGWMTAYAHNDSLLVGKGDVVQRGQVISRSGRTGSVSRPQAHFEIRRNGEPQDPLRLLSRK